MGLAPLASQIPLGVLAGILIKVGFDGHHGQRSHDVEKVGPGVRVVHVKGPLFFGSVSHMLDRIETVDKVINTQDIIIDCRKVDFMDLTAIFALDEMVERLLQHKIRPKVVTTPVIKEQLLQINTPYLKEAIIFTNMKSALR